MRFGEAAWASGLRAATAGSTTLRQTLVLERVSGRAGQEIDPGRALDPVRDRPGVGVGASEERLPPAERLRPVQRVEIVLDAQHGGRVDGLALEEALGELAALGQAEELRQRPRRRVGLKALRRAGLRIMIPCAASPPRTFCQEKVTTSSFGQSSSCAKAAEVASQIVRPLRSAAIQSPFGTRTPEVVPFQVKMTSWSKLTWRGPAIRRRALERAHVLELELLATSVAQPCQSFPTPEHRRRAGREATRAPSRWRRYRSRARCRCGSRRERLAPRG